MHRIPIPNGSRSCIRISRTRRTTVWPTTRCPTPTVTRRSGFLYGFPRSGTTLLDTIFRTHTSIDVAEEKPTLRDTLLLAYHDGAEGPRTIKWAELIDKFYRTDPVQLQEYYYQVLAREMGGELDPEKTYVDKMPLNTVFARMIKYIFPDALHIFALRDPADVILSCFFQNFRMNESMFQFTDMDRALSTYDKVMSYWVDAEKILDLNLRYVRYENLVQDLKAEVRPVIEGLGYEWEDSLVEFWKTARQREVIRTASAEQVTQKLYTTSAGKWTRYSALQGDTLKPLEKWRKHFGYA